MAKSIQSSVRNASSWDPQDDMLLRHLKEVKRLGWKEIAQYFQNRTPNACQFRWRRLKSGNLKSGSGNGVSAVGKDVSQVLGIQCGSGCCGAMRSEKRTAEGRGKAEGSCLIVNNDGESSRCGLADSNACEHKIGGGVAMQTVMFGSSGTTDAKKFVKPRSYSFNAAGVSLGGDEGSRVSDEENIGLIPKIFIRSRRGSVVQQSQQQQGQHLHSASLSPSALTVNNTLVNSKARKDSFSFKSRRSSFKIENRRRSVSQLVSMTSSRCFPVMASSISLDKTSNIDRRYSLGFNKEPFHVDSHTGSAQHQAKCFLSGVADVRSCGFQQGAHTLSSNPKLLRPWLQEEDELLHVRSQRKLSLDELSILLPHRSEQEIQSRLNSITLSDTNISNKAHFGSPFRPIRERSFNDEIAIEDEDDRNYESKDFTPIEYNNSSSSSHSSSNRNQPSPVFFSKSEESSPITSNGTTGSNATIPSELGDSNSKMMAFNDCAVKENTIQSAINYSVPTSKEFHNIMLHYDHNHPQAAAIPLPSLNRIFKKVL